MAESTLWRLAALRQCGHFRSHEKPGTLSRPEAARAPGRTSPSSLPQPSADFVRFAIRANRADKFMHKWAAIEKTHVFPVKPLISLFAVRTLVALSLFSIGLILTSVL